MTVAAGLVAALAACGGAQTATISLNEFTIKPKGVDAAVGKSMTLTVVNTGKVEHNLQVDSRVSDEPMLAVLQPGERRTVTFTPKVAGSYLYQCTIPGHSPAGMTGTLHVRA